MPFLQNPQSTAQRSGNCSTRSCNTTVGIALNRLTSLTKPQHLQPQTLNPKPQTLVQRAEEFVPLLGIPQGTYTLKYPDLPKPLS